MSTRQLERLFRRYLSRSPKRYYMELRLGKARNLLLQTDMSVINVALACGFTSPSHFSKCYRALYKTTPYRERGSSGEPRPGRGSGDLAPRPEPPVEQTGEHQRPARLGGAARRGREVAVAEHLADRAEELRAVGDRLARRPPASPR